MGNLVSLSSSGSSSNVEVLWAFFHRNVIESTISLLCDNAVCSQHDTVNPCFWIRKKDFFLLPLVHYSTTLFPSLKSTRTCWSSSPICCLEVTSPARNRRKPSSTPSRTPRWRWCARPDATWTWCASTVRTWTRSWCHRVTETEAAMKVAMRTETEMGRQHHRHRRRFLLLWQWKQQQQVHQQHQSLKVNVLFEQPMFWTFSWYLYVTLLIKQNTRIYLKF